MLTRSKRIIVIHIKDLIKAAIMKRVCTVGFIKKLCFLPTSLLTQHYVSLIIIIIIIIINRLSIY